ncbi:hypothetical protein CJ030_MR1G018344 [Morella rubra]|uniref:Viral late gene transcription factor 3 zinc ribbon domain-containing protein n=1 Tax=Morella rubra TaxID=262757 RepID=A0A6A1WMR2_9ROSI|nr:hypothetical protein CJ030_MR1G018344 [Morella rubra]
METLGPSVSSSFVRTAPTAKHSPFATKAGKPHPILTSQKSCTRSAGNRRLTTRTSVIQDVSAVTSPTGVVVTWQIAVGAAAGVTPFVVAGIEFGKRIIAQRRCEVCGGSGLVLRDKEYFRCPGCGGFLPWQSWKRFFSG